MTASTAPTGWPPPRIGAGDAAETTRLVDSQLPQEPNDHCCPRPFRAVGNLEGTGAPVGQGEGMHRFGAILGDRPGSGPHERRDIPVGPAHVLRMGCHRMGDPAPALSGAASDMRANALASPTRLMATAGAPQPSTPVAEIRSPDIDSMPAAAARWTG